MFTLQTSIKPLLVVGGGGEQGRPHLPAVRDLTRDGRLSTYDVSVLKKREGKMRSDRTPFNATITNKTRPAGSFSSSLPGRVPCRPGVLCIGLFYEGGGGGSKIRW